MRLQSDPTVLYGRDERRPGDLHGCDLERPTPHNTYVIPGLPPSPIANPGRGALEAAVDPAATDALYFVARGDGSHEFTSTLAAHNAAVRRFQRDQLSAPGQLFDSRSERSMLTTLCRNSGRRVRLETRLISSEARSPAEPRIIMASDWSSTPVSILSIDPCRLPSRSMAAMLASTAATRAPASVAARGQLEELPHGGFAAGPELLGAAAPPWRSAPRWP